MRQGGTTPVINVGHTPTSMAAARDRRPLLSGFTPQNINSTKKKVRRTGGCLQRLCCKNKLLLLSGVLWMCLLAFSLIYGEVFFGMFGVFSIPDLPASNTTGVRAPFDRALVTGLARTSATACCPAAAVASWTCANCVNPIGSVSVITSNSSGGLQAVVVVGTPLNHTNSTATITVAFRGQASTRGAGVRQANASKIFGGADGMLVHDGFQQAYMELRTPVRARLASLCHRGLRGLSGLPSLPVSVTGHALGGSLATLCAFDLAVNPVCGGRGAGGSSGGGRAQPTTLATFGMPRTGNTAFVEAFARATQRAGMVVWRVVHKGDGVPANIPRSVRVDGVLYDYRHTSREVWFSEDNEDYAVCDGSGEDPRCSASVPALGHAVVDQQVYMGVAFTNPCGGRDVVRWAEAFFGGATGLSLVVFVVFVARCRRACASSPRGGGLDDAHLALDINDDSA